MQFGEEFQNGAPLPQIIIVGDLGILRSDSLLHMYIDQLIKSADGCYEAVSKHQFHMMELHEYKYRHILRILPYKRCLDRMIQKGYYRGNKSLGPSTDFERAFAGFDSPMLQKVNEIKLKNP